MKQYYKIVLLVVVLSTIVLCAKQVSNKIVTSFNSCVSFMANNTSGVHYLSL